MEDIKALKLFEQILAKTKAGRLKWELTASESEYFSVLPDGFIVSIQRSDEEDGWGNEVKLVALSLRKGAEELLRVTSAVDGVGEADLEQLYELARRRALGVDAQVDRLLGELAKL